MLFSCIIFISLSDDNCLRGFLFSNFSFGRSGMGTLNRAGRARRNGLDARIRLSLCVIFGGFGGIFSFNSASCRIIGGSEWSRGFEITFLLGDKLGVLPLLKRSAIILFARFSRQYLHRLILQYRHVALTGFTVLGGIRLALWLSSLAKGDTVLFVEDGLPL